MLNVRLVPRVSALGGWDLVDQVSLACIVGFQGIWDGAHALMLRGPFNLSSAFAKFPGLLFKHLPILVTHVPVRPQVDTALTLKSTSNVVASHSPHDLEQIQERLRAGLATLVAGAAHQGIECLGFNLMINARPM